LQLVTKIQIPDVTAENLLFMDNKFHNIPVNNRF